MIDLPQNQTPTEELKQLAPLATKEVRIYLDYMCQEANSSAVNFASRGFSIIWVDDKILGVSAIEYGKCDKCFIETFEGSWHYAQKWEDICLQLFL